jgi:hypothetical integral membrane protein (TIGR02206 family)
MGGSSQYWTAVALGVACCVAACLVARRFPGRPARIVGRVICVVLVVDAVTYALSPAFEGTWSVRESLPLSLCDVALVIAAVTCAYPEWQLGVELTYFWGLAGTLQGVLTPDLSVSFPHLAFFEFVIGHLGIVIAALYLVVGLGRKPRPGSVPRIFGITVAYAVFVGVFDWLTGANYMYLARIPRKASLLSVLGPWPWYIASAAGVAVVLFALLNALSRLLPSPPADIRDRAPTGPRTRV